MLRVAQLAVGAFVREVKNPFERVLHVQSCRR
jgi:hypothetical protein